ncbi:MAG TPA: flagellar FliJ family protein [bacterium]|nr:flagellar FliJ family protein [bacterium]
MARRQFRLEAVWRVRHLLEEKVKRELGELQAELTRLRQDRRDIDENILAEHRRVDLNLRDGMRAEDLQQAMYYINALHEKQGFAQLEEVDVRERLAEKRREYLAVSRDRQVIDRLRDKFLARRDYEENREQEKAVMEIALNRFLRAQRQEEAEE